MHVSPKYRAVSVDQYMRRSRHLRSAAAIALFAAIGRAAIHTVERAFIRPYRMTRTPGCGCEA